VIPYYQTEINGELATVHRHKTRWAIFAPVCEDCGKDALALVLDAAGQPDALRCPCGASHHLSLVGQLAAA